MNAHVTPPANVVRFPARVRLVSDNARLSDSRPFSALDTLLSAGMIDDRQHAAGQAYAAARRSHDRAQRHGGLSPEQWAAMKRERAALLEVAGFDRFLLDRLCLDDDAPLRCEVERVREALGRVVRTMSS